MNQRRGSFAILASGTGSNAQALIDAVAAGRISADVACIVSDRSDAGVISRGQAAGVPVVVLVPEPGESRDQYERKLVSILREHGARHVVLAGWMRICGQRFLQVYGGTTINVHPSLLPEFPGRDAIGDALAAGARQTGVTVHFIDAGIDTGPIVAQRALEIYPHDTRESLAMRVHAVEHELLPQVTAQLVTGSIDCKIPTHTPELEAHRT